MKKYPLVLLIFLSCAHTYGQSISLTNLLNLTSLTSKDASDVLTMGKVFKLKSGEKINEFVTEHYETTAPENRTETIIIGAGSKTSTGGILHTVSYVTTNTQNILNLIAQAKTQELIPIFKGADKKDNVFIYDSFLYHIVFYISHNGDRGVADITQKEVYIQ
jgi:hypothetical protein